MAKVARYTFLYFVGNMAAAVLLGILLVNLIKPGRGQPLASAASCVLAPDVDQVCWPRMLPEKAMLSTLGVMEIELHLLDRSCLCVLSSGELDSLQETRNSACFSPVVPGCIMATSFLPWGASVVCISPSP